jgi:diadenosine tetraphosphatase ApaH/serine/threonine PP2A family protein phosphatase
LDEERKRCETKLPPFPDPLKLGDQRLIINPGSVGQPRDGDPRAAYAILDVDEKVFEFRRVTYSIFIAQERMRARGLPRRLIERLEVGR